MLDNDNSGFADMKEFIACRISLRGDAKASQLEKVSLLGRETKCRIKLLEQNFERLAKALPLCMPCAYEPRSNSELNYRNPEFQEGLE